LQFRAHAVFLQRLQNSLTLPQRLFSVFLFRFGMLQCPLQRSLTALPLLHCLLRLVPGGIIQAAAEHFRFLFRCGAIRQLLRNRRMDLLQFLLQPILPVQLVCSLLLRLLSLFFLPLQYVNCIGPFPHLLPNSAQFGFNLTGNVLIRQFRWKESLRLLPELLFLRSAGGSQRGGQCALFLPLTIQLLRLLFRLLHRLLRGRVFRANRQLRVMNRAANRAGLPLCQVGSQNSRLFPTESPLQTGCGFPGNSCPLFRSLVILLSFLKLNCRFPPCIITGSQLLQMALPGLIFPVCVGGFFQCGAGLLRSLQLLFQCLQLQLQLLFFLDKGFLLFQQLFIA